MRLLQTLGILALAVSAVFLAMTVLPPVLLPDAPAPASLAPFIAEARQQIRAEATENFRLPLHLRFLEARCAADNRGTVALIFEEWRPPYLTTTFAVAWRGSMPTANDNSWGGGVGMRSFETDEEFLYQLGPNSIRCS